MNQLPLKIVNRIPYKKDNLVLHSGIKDLYEICLQSATSDKFQIMYIEGSGRTGKTHIAVSLTHDLSSQGLFPRLINGQELLDRLNADEFNHDWHVSDVLIVDDSDICFSEINPGFSGRFVDLVETMRTANSTLILLSSLSRDSLPCDEHILSRINQGAGFVIQAPEVQEVAQVMDLMARQRGMSLSDSKREYLVRRVSRSIAQIEERLDNISYLSQLLGEKVKFPLLAKSL